MTNNEVEHDRYDAPQKMRDDDLGVKRIWSGNIYDTLTELDQSCRQLFLGLWTSKQIVRLMPGIPKSFLRPLSIMYDMVHEFAVTNSLYVIRIMLGMSRKHAKRNDKIFKDLCGKNRISQTHLEHAFVPL